MPYLRSIVLLCALAACAVCWATSPREPIYNEGVISVAIRNLSSTLVKRLMDQYAENRAALPNGITVITGFPEDGMIIAKGTESSVNQLYRLLTQRDINDYEEIYIRKVLVENEGFLLVTSDERNPLSVMGAFYPKGILSIVPLPAKRAILVSAKSEEALDLFESLVNMLDTQRRNIVLEVQTVSMPTEIADSFGAPTLYEPPKKDNRNKPIDLASLLTSDHYTEYYKANIELELDLLLKARKAKRLFFTRLSVLNCEGASARLTVDVKAAPLVISRVEVRDDLITVDAAPNQPKLPAFANLIFPTLRLHNGEMGVLAVDPDPANPANRLLLMVRAIDAFDLPVDGAKKRDDKLKGSKK